MNKIIDFILKYKAVLITSIFVLSFILVFILLFNGVDTPRFKTWWLKPITDAEIGDIILIGMIFSWSIKIKK